MPTPLRRAVERRSGPALAYLRMVPPWVPLLGVLALVLGGLFAPAALGALLLALVAAFLAWMTYLAAPALSPGARVLRVAVIAIVLAAAANRAWGG